jgi:hypothetical protein
MRFKSLNMAQRIIVVVAFGMAFGVAGSYLVNLGSPAVNLVSPANLGSPAFSSDVVLRFPGTGLPAWLRVIIWLGLVAVWALISVGVLRESAEDGRKRPSASKPDL